MTTGRCTGARAGSRARSVAGTRRGLTGCTRTQVGLLVARKSQCVPVAAPTVVDAAAARLTVAPATPRPRGAVMVGAVHDDGAVVLRREAVLETGLRGVMPSGVEVQVRHAGPDIDEGREVEGEVGGGGPVAMVEVGGVEHLLEVCGEDDGIHTGLALEVIAGRVAVAGAWNTSHITSE